MQLLMINVHRRGQNVTINTETKNSTLQFGVHSDQKYILKQKPSVFLILKQPSKIYLVLLGELIPNTIDIFAIPMI